MRPIIRLETARLLLRGWRTSDAPAVQAALSASERELGRPAPTLDETAELLTRLGRLSTDGTEWHFGLFALDGDDVIGGVGVTPLPDSTALELGYWLHTARTGMGYATEAVAAVVEHARSERLCAELQIQAPADHPRSLAIPRRLGFQQASSRVACVERWVLRM